MDNDFKDIDGEGMTDELTTPVKPLDDVQPGVDNSQYVQQVENVSQFFQQPNENTGNFEQYMMPVAGEGAKKKKDKKPWSKGKIAAVVGGSSAVVAALVCLFIFVIGPKLGIFGKNDPKKVVAEAGKETYSKLVNDNSSVGLFNSQFGFSEIYNKHLLTGGDTSFDISLNSISLYEDMPSVGLSSTGSYDPVNKLMNCDVTLMGANEELLGIEIVGDAANTYFRFPEVIKDYIKFSNNDAYGVLENSAFGTYFDGVDLPEVSINYFPEVSESGEIEISEEIVNAIEELWDNVEVSKDGSEEITILDESVKAEKYIVTFDPETLQKVAGYVLEYVFNTIENNPVLAERMEDVLVYRDYIDMYLPMILNKDLNIDVYVCDDEIVKISVKDDISISTLVLSYNIEAAQYNGNIYANVGLSSFGQYIGFTANIADYYTAPHGDVTVDLGYGSFKYEFKTDVFEDDNRYTKTYNGSLGFGRGIGVNVSFTTDYSKTDGKLSFDAKLLNSNGDSVSFKANCMTDKSVKNESLILEDGSWVISSSDNQNINGNFSFSIDTSKTSAHNIDSSVDVYDLATLDYQKLQKIFNSNQDAINDWLIKFESNEFVQFIENEKEKDEPHSDPDDYPYIEPIDDVQFSEDDKTLHDNGEPIVLVHAYLPGFTVKFADGIFVDYYNQDGSIVEFELQSEYEYPQEYIETNYTDQSMQQQDGDRTIYYVTWQEGEVLHFRGATKLSNGYVVSIGADLRDADNLQLEDLFKAFGTDSLIEIK